jgi:hypothetical protein
MLSPERREGRPRSGGSPEARRAARLLRRRRGWTWTAAGSLAGLVMYVILGVNFFGNLTGAANVISAVPVFVLLGLIPFGLIAAVADTVRLHRLEAVIRAGMPGGTLDGILPRPSRHQGAGVILGVILACLVLPALLYLPRQVDAVAYLAGAGPQDTFVPVSHRQVCGKEGCSTVTDGILENGGESVTWPGRTPLGRSFTVRTPVWAAGPGRTLTPGTGTATGRVILGLFFDVIAAFAMAVLIGWMRQRLTRHRALDNPAGAG